MLRALSPFFTARGEEQHIREVVALKLTTTEKNIDTMVDWTDDRIAALSNQDLKNLLANAERKDVATLVATCKAEMEKRGASKPRGVGKPRSEIKEFELDTSAQIAAVGREMAAKYDLSVETAKAASAGVKRFQAHKLLDNKGFAKLGGLQRAGHVAVDRYISHRRGDNVVSLGVFLQKDQPIADHEFHVIAPSAMLEGGAPVDAIRPIAAEKQKPSADHARAFKDLPSAAVAFDAALKKLTA